MVAIREGNLESKGEDDSSTDWGESLWRLDVSKLCLVSLDEESGEEYAKFTLSDIHDIEIDAKNRECRFQHAGRTIQLRAETADLAQAWYKDLTRATDDMENLPAAANRISQSSARKTSSPPAAVQGSVRAAIGSAVGEGGLEEVQKMLERRAKRRAGYVTSMEYEKVLRKDLRLDAREVPDEHIKTIFTWLSDKSAEDDASMAISAFMSYLEQSDDDGAEMERATSGETAAINELKAEIDGVLQRIRARVKTLTKGGEQGSLDKFFKLCDKNGDGELELDEFVVVIRKRLKFSEKAIPEKLIHKLFEILDEDDGGSISVAEFTDFVTNVEYESSEPTGLEHPLHRLYALHEQKRKEREAKRKAYEEAEFAKIEEEKMKVKATGSRWPKDRENSAVASRRLYQDFFDAEARKQERARYHWETQQAEIEENKRRNRPTRSHSAPRADVEEVSQRLYDDAGRREMDRQQAVEDQLQAEKQRFTASYKRQPSVQEALTRCMDLYDEAGARTERRRMRKQELEDEERKYMANSHVNAKIKGRQLNVDRLEELHAEHVERQRRCALAMAEKQLKEEEAIAKNRPKSRSRSVTPPPRIKPLYTPRRIEDPRARNNKPARSSTPRKLVTQAEFNLKTLVSTISNRCGYFADVDSMWGPEHQKLVKPLQAAMQVYQEALKNCETDEGYLSLRFRPSLDLYQERLMAQPDGWARGVQPDSIMQIQDDLNDLRATAKLAQALLKQHIVGNLDWKRGTAKPHPAKLPLALYAYDPGVKSEASARAKATSRFGPSEGSNCYRHLLDLSRLLLVFSTCDMLQAGLDQIIKRFEVVSVRNYFSTPGSLGVRFVEVLVIVKVDIQGQQVPHVCELRLEELCFHKAQELATPLIEEVFMGSQHLVAGARDLGAVLHLVHTKLMKPPPSHDLVVFRRHVAHRFGSTVCAWRRALGGGRHMSFEKFRDLCNSVKCGEHVTEFWQTLDPTMAGRISLFDFDPQAVGVLVKMRSRMLALSDCAESQTDAGVLFRRMTYLVRARRSGHLEFHEFRQAVKPMGITQNEADTAFGYLDYYGGRHHAPPATVREQDIAWLMRLPSFVSCEYVSMDNTNELSDVDAFRHITWQRQQGRRSRRREEILRWSMLGERDGNAGQRPGGDVIFDDDDEISGGVEEQDVQDAKVEESVQPEADAESAEEFYDTWSVGTEDHSAATSAGRRITSLREAVGLHPDLEAALSRSASVSPRSTPRASVASSSRNRKYSGEAPSSCSTSSMAARSTAPSSGTR
eukprot:TRINITY_DN4510_c0_g1_i2.p1 TRINITY_DN4510_c0_g1~~TRINITY_DN4510_c0_g1_i2.p1  ORF type:complete len:1268 (+),score=185.38 TRINITY_DN4510_c0_g1_i2:75-3878(+)